MSKRKWKPGDVAVLTTRCCGGLVATKNRGASWHAAGGIDLEVTCQIADARPLVVIDPEDREQVERLANRLADLDGERHNSDLSDVIRAWVAVDLQAALREFANPTPPKPEEPTTWLAAVEDADGNRWCLHGGPTEPGLEWYSPDLNCRAAYADIDAVRVLSEGWSA